MLRARLPGVPCCAYNERSSPKHTMAQAHTARRTWQTDGLYQMRADGSRLSLLDEICCGALAGGQPVGTSVCAPRMRGCLDGATYGPSRRRALACPIR